MLRRPVIGRKLLFGSHSDTGAGLCSLRWNETGSTHTDGRGGRGVPWNPTPERRSPLDERGGRAEARLAARAGRKRTPHRIWRTQP